MRKILISILTLGAMLSFGFNIKGADVPPPTVTNTLLYSGYYMIYAEWAIPEGTKYFELTIPIYNILVMTQTGSNIKSYINFMDASKTTIQQFDFEDLGGSLYGIFRFISDRYELDGTQFVGIGFMHNEGSSLPSGLIADMQTNVTLKANNVLRYVTYLTQGVLYQSSLFVDIPSKPSNPTAPTGYVFNGWVLGNGEPYNYTAITEEQLFNDTLYLYADFVPENYTDPIPEPTSNVPTDLRNILALVRLDNTDGYGIFFIIISIILIGGGVLFLRLNAFILAIVELIWLGLSMYLGLITIWIGIVIGLFIVLIILYRMKVDV